MSKKHQFHPRVIPCTWPGCNQLFKTHGGRNSHITTVHTLAAAAAAAQQPPGPPPAEGAAGEPFHDLGAHPTPSPPPPDEAQEPQEPETVVETHPHITGESQLVVECFEPHSHFRRGYHRRTVQSRR